MDFYKIIVAPKAMKDLKPFPQRIVQAIWESIKSLQNNPRPINCKKLKGTNAEEYRLRVKDNYRVLYQIDDEAKQIHILRIFDRKDAYR